MGFIWRNNELRERTDHVEPERHGVPGDEPRGMFRPVNHGSHDPPRITQRKGQTHRGGLFVVVPERVAGKDDGRRDAGGDAADDDEDGKVEYALRVFLATGGGGDEYRRIGAGFFGRRDSRGC